MDRSLCFRVGVCGVILGLILAVPGGPEGAAAGQSPPKVKKDGNKKKKSPDRMEDKKKAPALNFKMKSIDGKERDLKAYHGNVILMVNVASNCGLTPQYEGLQALYEKYAEKGFVILGFPANNFGHQEPGTNEEIKAFCTSRYQVTFPMFAKVSVRGKEICPLYQYLTDEKAKHGQGGLIPWNFTKFIINRKGEVVKRFGPRTPPPDEKLVALIEGELGKAVPKDSPLGKKKKKAKPRA
ncbi:MAG: glutathione peroxidase [Phycisphaerae bacterium]